MTHFKKNFHVESVRCYKGQTNLHNKPQFHLGTHKQYIYQEHFSKWSKLQLPFCPPKLMLLLPHLCHLSQILNSDNILLCCQIHWTAPTMLASHVIVKWVRLSPFGLENHWGEGVKWNPCGGSPIKDRSSSICMQCP